MAAQNAIAFMLIGCMFGIGIGAVIFECPLRAQPIEYWEMESLNARQRAQYQAEQQRLERQLQQERDRRRNNPC